MLTFWGCCECLVDPKDLGVTRNEYFSLSKHTKQLLLVTYCDTPAGIEVSFEVSFRTHGRTDGGRTDGRTDRRGSRNSYLDIEYFTRLTLKTYLIVEN